MDPFIGEIKLFAGSFAPEGWAYCDGSLLPISENDALFSLVGTTYGGDGVSTFAVPDLRGRVPIHVGTGIGLSPYVMGQAGGAETVTLTTNNVPAHSHVVLTSTAAGNANVPTGNVLAVAPTGSNLYRETNGTVAFTSGEIAPSAGGNQPHDNMQPFQVINYIIATTGVYPPRS